MTARARGNDPDDETPDETPPAVTPTDDVDLDATDADAEDEGETPADDDAPAADSPAKADRYPIPTDRGEMLFYEPGGSWWVTAIGPILVAAVLAMEISGPGQVHWWVIGFFGLIVTGFSTIQVIAARRHVSVELTELTLKQGARIIALDEIDTIYPENNGPDHRDWQSASALGELAGVPRRRRGVGVKLADGSLAQAWARDVGRFRSELTEAHTAVKLGLPPRGTSTSTD
ncbi:hypothetical protein ACLQ3C_11835 [Gordonia sp. DT30]|uniref:hypothetical protein n=1 Tax=Gordonia sp. DT30 TaxID=3416546 RepID=UPI003CF73C0B